MVRQFVIGAAVIIALVLVIPTGVMNGAASESADVKSPETVLRMGFLHHVDSLNPYVGITDTAYILYSLLYDSLQGVGSDLKPVSDLATSWWIVPESDPDLVISGEPYGSVWQYNLTTNAYWHDGEPFTADDVVFNINLNAMNYEVMWAYQPYAYYMSYAAKVDSYTVRIHYFDRVTGNSMPVAYGGLICMPMLPKHKLEDMTAYDIAFSWSGVFLGEDPPIVGTGPFMATTNIYDEWLTGDRITLVRNPDYHGEDEGRLIYFDKLVMSFYDESTAMRLALQSCELDFADLPPQAYSDLVDLIDAGDVENITAFTGLNPTGYWTDIVFNLNNAGPNPARLDPAIRHAMAMATDKTYILQNYYYGYGEEGSTLISPVNSQWHCKLAPDDVIPVNLTAAMNLLESSGYRDSDGDGIRECQEDSLAVLNGWVSEGTPLSFEMVVRREHPEERDIAMHLDQMWTSVGIDVNYTIVPELYAATIMYSYEYDTAIWYWSYDPDPNYMLFCQSQKSWSGWSDNLYTSPFYEENYTASVQTLNNDERKTYVDNCQRVHYFDTPYIILAYMNQTVAWRNDTFIGWGDWAAHPERSIKAFWSGNPLYFDLYPRFGPNAPPLCIELSVFPNPAPPGSDVLFNVSAVDLDGDSLSYLIEFGDGNYSVATTGGGTTDPQPVQFIHSYAANGFYSVTLWVNDSNESETHNVSVTYLNRVLVGEEGALVVIVSPSLVSLDANESVMLHADVTWNGTPLDGSSGLRYHWSATPSTLGEFDSRIGREVVFTSGITGGSGTVNCTVTLYEASAIGSANVSVRQPDLDAVIILPPHVTMVLGASRVFSAEAVDAWGNPVGGAVFAWTVEGMEPGDYELNATVGPSVTFTAFALGNAWLNATATAGNITRTGSALIQVLSELPTRSVDYRWYDMFNVPFGEWWTVRWDTYHEEQIIGDEYPYVFIWYSSPKGNIFYESNMRLEITGRKMPELNMSERPEFLPFLGTERGGNAVLDWYMQYLTTDELARYPGSDGWGADGWVICLNGTTTLDKQAAKAVLGVTDAGYDNFGNWWMANEYDVEYSYAAWMTYEGNDRLDIYNMYEYPFTLLCFDLSAAKTGVNITVTYDIVSWGMEALMARWLHDVFMPNEWYYEGMNFEATIGPERTDIDIHTVVDYAIHAWDTINPQEGQTYGGPCWTWEGQHGDYVQSSTGHPKSDFNPYVPHDYLNKGPGSYWYGKMMPFYYTPASFNLTESERLSFEWPSGVQLFFAQARYENGTPILGRTYNVSELMAVVYMEPMPIDIPGSVEIDRYNRSLIFTGPIDFWAWSKDQTEHQYLSDEWDRLGVLPYGMPYLEFMPRPNTQPVACFTVTPTEGNLSTVFNVDSSLSTDVEDASAGLLVRWDWSNDSAWDTSWSVQKTAQHQYTAVGTYTIVLEVMDSGLLTNRTTLDVLVKDVESPHSDLTLSGEPGSNGWYLSDVTVTIAATDAHSSVASTWYKVDADQWHEYSGAFLLTAEGQHVVGYYSVDSYGNEETIRSAEVKIDKTVPVTSRILSGTLGLNEWYISPLSVTLTTLYDVSGILGTYYSLDGSPEQVYASSFGVSGEGLHVLTYYSLDTAGHEEVVNVVYISIDTESPVTHVLVMGTQSESGWYNTPVTVVLSVSSDISGINHTYYRLGDGEWLTYDGVFTIDINGTLSLETQSEDVAGNLEDVTARTLKIDRIPPALTYSGPTSFSTSTVTISWSQSDSLSGLDHVETSFDGAVFVDVNLATSASMSNLSDGFHSLRIRAIDAAGNVVEIEVIFEVDTEAGLASLAIYVAAAVIVGIAVLALLLVRRWRTGGGKEDIS